MPGDSFRERNSKFGQETNFQKICAMVNHSSFTCNGASYAILFVGKSQHATAVKTYNIATSTACTDNA